MLSFLYWWLEQLAGIVPASFGSRFARRPDALIVGIGEAEISLSRRRGGRLGALGQFAADATGFDRLSEAIASGGDRPRRTVLSVPPAWLLRKRLVLPLAARRELRKVLSFELQRETPFSADEIWWDYEARSADHSTKTVEVELTVLPRALARPVLGELRSRGIAPTAVEIPGGSRATGLLMLDDRAVEGGRSLRPAAAVAGAVLGLVLFAVVAVFFRQYELSAAAASELAVLKSQAEEASALRKKIDRATQAADFIAAAREKAGSPLAAVAATTQLLPDSAHLTDFIFHRRRVTLTGLSPAAASLVGAIVNTPPFSDPALAAPVVRTEHGLESFTIRASFGRESTP
jgi:general secretion pathway protein L